MVKVSVPALVEGAIYVPGLPREYVSERYGIPLSDVAKLGSTENPHGPSPKAVRALAERSQARYLSGLDCPAFA